MKEIMFIGGAIDSAVGYAHYCASRMDGQFNLVGGYFSPRPTVNAATAIKYNTRPYGSDNEVIFARPDLVVVLTPTPEHYDTVKSLLCAGIPVLCEKALACSSVDIAHLISLRGDTPLSVVYNYSAYPMIACIAAAIECGRLGEIQHFQIEMPQEGYLRTNPQAWRRTDSAVPTIYLDLMVHLHQLIYVLIKQRPLLVNCRHIRCSDIGVIDNVVCLAEYTNRIQGQFWFSKTALGERNGLKLRIYGTEGAMEWRQEDPEHVIYSEANGYRSIVDRAYLDEPTGLDRFKPGHPAGWIEALANMYLDMDAPEFRPEVALEGLRMCEAMVQSAENNGIATPIQLTRELWARKPT